MTIAIKILPKIVCGLHLFYMEIMWDVWLGDIRLQHYKSELELRSSDYKQSVCGFFFYCCCRLFFRFLTQNQRVRNSIDAPLTFSNLSRWWLVTICRRGVLKKIWSLREKPNTYVFFIYLCKLSRLLPKLSPITDIIIKWVIWKEFTKMTHYKVARCV